jgi:hypothetical protein
MPLKIDRENFTVPISSCGFHRRPIMMMMMMTILVIIVSTETVLYCRPVKYVNSLPPIVKIKIKVKSSLHVWR